MAGTVVADTLQAASTSTLVIKNGVANTPPTIQDSAGTQIGTFCRAWVNFNGTGTVAIRSSFNVTSVTDNGTGTYTVNLTTAAPDANGASAMGAYNGTGSPSAGTFSASVYVICAYVVSSSAIQVNSITSGNVYTDLTQYTVAFFR